MLKNRLILLGVMIAMLAALETARAADEPKQKPNFGPDRVATKSFLDLDADSNKHLSIEEIFGGKPPRDSRARKTFDWADRDKNDWLTPPEYNLLRAAAVKAVAMKKAQQRKPPAKKKPAAKKPSARKKPPAKRPPAKKGGNKRPPAKKPGRK